MVLQVCPLPLIPTLKLQSGNALQSGQGLWLQVAALMSNRLNQSALVTPLAIGE